MNLQEFDMLASASLNDADAARSLQRAIEQTLAEGVRTGDIGGSASTTQVGDAVLAALRASGAPVIS